MSGYRATQRTDPGERESFLSTCRQPHRKIRRCFMTGKTCVYDETIERRLRETENGDRPATGFMVIAFRPNLDAFYDWCLTRFFDSRYGEGDGGTLQRADKIRRTGYVICEKICKHIQEAAFVVVDISVDNANVLYEFGIAYGLRQKIIVIHDTESTAAGTLKRQYLPEDMLPKVYVYPSIKPIPEQESFTQRIYHVPEGHLRESQQVPGPRIVILDLTSHHSETTADARRPEPCNDIRPSFVSVVQGAIGVSIAKIVDELENDESATTLTPQHIKMISGMRTAVAIGPSQDTRFDTIRAEIDRSFCVLVRTSETHPFSYFWLGYCHAIGKNVIPIYETALANDRIDDLAFDIRSLWHLVLVKQEPTQILSELQEILKQMIVTDFGEWSRREFWSRVFGRSGRVSIFTGALRNKEFEREMVGDWDLRTASELMSYFSSHQQIAAIESPIYQPPDDTGKVRQYREQISKLLEGRNAVVVASSDVNPMTELLLGRLYGVPDELLFSGHGREEADNYPVATIAVKRRREAKGDASSGDPGRFFFVQQPTDEATEERGFRGNWLPKRELLQRYRGQTEQVNGDFELYAHLVIALNPFPPEPPSADHGDLDSENFVVILNGISGPSTFALTQLLTGGMGGEFVDYGKLADARSKSDDRDVFDPHLEAEGMLSHLVEELQNHVGRKKNFCGIQAIVKVTVGPPSDDVASTFDSRRVKSWSIVDETVRLIERRHGGSRHAPSGGSSAVPGQRAPEEGDGVPPAERRDPPAEHADPRYP